MFVLPVGGAGKTDKKPHLRWNRDHIMAILKNEVYLGRYVTGKDRVCLYRHEKQHAVEKEQWNVFENHHDEDISATNTKKGMGSTR